MLLAADTVYLVSCVGKKRSEPTLAKDLYVSRWFLLARAYVEATGCPWFILSAKHGLVAPDQMLAPYEQTLNTMSVVERRAWASRIQAQMEQQLPATSRIVVFAGLRYRKNLIDYLRQRAPVVEVPMEGLPIGKQLQWLRLGVARLSDRQSTTGYFGETVIRNLGGQWCDVRELKAIGLPAEAFAASLVIGPAQGDEVPKPGGHLITTYADPIGRVFRRLFNGAEDDLISFYDYMASRIQGHH